MYRVIRVKSGEMQSELNRQAGFGYRFVSCTPYSWNVDTDSAFGIGTQKGAVNEYQVVFEKIEKPK